MSLAQVKSVSIITRTKNRPEFLRRACESVLSQSYEYLQWVVVNDGGDTGPVDAVVNFAERNGLTVIVEHSERPLGRTIAANVGARAVKSQYMMFLDDDDTMSVRFVEEMVSSLNQRPNCVGVVGSVDAVIESRIDDEFKTIRRKPFYVSNSPPSLAALTYRNLIPNMALLIEKQAFEAVGGFNERLDLLEDWDFLLRVLMYGDLCSAKNAKAFYHIRPGAEGDEANSLHMRHREAEVYLRNEHFRADYKHGRVGLGLLMAVRDPLTQDRFAKLMNMLSSLKAPTNILRNIRKHKDK